MPQLRSLIAEANAARVPNIIVFSGQSAGQAEDEGQRNVVTALKQLAADAEQMGVTLIFEMFCAQNHPDYQAVRSSYGFGVVKAVGSPAVKVLYDIYHMSRMGEDVIGDITHNRELIAHLHAAESPERSVPFRAGNINYGQIVKAATAAGYAGLGARVRSWRGRRVRRA